MLESIPPIVAAPLILILGVSALYICYIKPGYEKDENDRRTSGKPARSNKG